MDRFARGGFNIGYEARVDLKELRRKRIEKAQTERKKAGLDALLVWKDENQDYEIYRKNILKNGIQVNTKLFDLGIEIQ